jgi:tetratricopeptide (TPR) repeat protein
MRQLFISYRSSDAVKVDKIARDLTLLTDTSGAQLYSTWQDKHNLPPASPHWWDAIVDAIIACDVFVFNMSRASLESDVCRAELDYAHQRNRPIIPVVLDGEFILDAKSGKYNITYWNLVPDWLAERQFLFYIPTEFYGRFQAALAVFDRTPPRDIDAPRPLNPDNKSEHRTNHARYAQACDYAAKLALVEARKYFAALVSRNDADYGDMAAEWLELLHRYEELIEIVNQNSPAVVFKKKWSAYTGLFPKEFIDGLFDPQNLQNRATGIVQTVAPVLPAPVPAAATPTAEEWFYKALTAKTFDEKIRCYTEAIHLKPNYIVAYLKRGNAYRSKGEHERAIADYTEAIRLKPDYDSAYLARARAYSEKQNLERAIVDYTEAIRLKPYYVHTYNTRGNAYYKKGDYDHAIADYEAALRIKPNHHPAKKNLALAREQKATTALAPIPVANPILTAEEWVKRGWAATHSDEKIRCYTEAIRLKPDYADAYHSRGRVYVDKGDSDLAIADFNEAIHLNPNYATAYNSRGVVYFYVKHDFERAIADYTEAIRLKPDYSDAYHNRGHVYYNKFDYDRAIADYETVLRINPTDEIAKSKLMEARQEKAGQ